MGTILFLYKHDGHAINTLRGLERSDLLARELLLAPSSSAHRNE